MSCSTQANMNDQITYQLATLADIELIVKYRFALLNEIADGDIDDINDAMRENMENYFARALPDKSYICWLAMDGDKLVGIGGMVIKERPISYKRPSGLSGYIMGMYTVREYRKRHLLCNHRKDAGDGERNAIKWCGPARY